MLLKGIEKKKKRPWYVTENSHNLLWWFFISLATQSYLLASYTVLEDIAFILLSPPMFPFQYIKTLLQFSGTEGNICAIMSILLFFLFLFLFADIALAYYTLNLVTTCARDWEENIQDMICHYCKILWFMSKPTI